MLADPLADLRLGAIRRADLLDYRSRLVRRCGDMKNTMNKVLGVLKVIFGEAVYREDLENNPTAGIGSIKEHRRQPDTFSLDELQLLFPTETLGPWRDLEEHALFLLTAACGLRRGEVLVLRWEQLHLEDGYVTIDRARKGQREEGGPKWDHVRTARVAILRDRVPARLKEWREQLLLTRKRPIQLSDYVFADPFGAPRGFTWFSKRFRAAMRRFDPQGERRLTPHGLRHSHATILRAAGKDAAMIRASLGWYEERTQQRYEHLRPADLAALDIE